MTLFFFPLDFSLTRKRAHQSPTSESSFPGLQAAEPNSCQSDDIENDELLAKLEKLEADNAAMKKAMEATNEAIKRLEAGKA